MATYLLRRVLLGAVTLVAITFIVYGLVRNMPGSPLTVQLGDPEIYKDGGAQASALQKRLHAAEAEHSAALGRWMELDARKDA